MRDWKGNIINVGDTVIVYKFLEPGYEILFKGVRRNRTLAFISSKRYNDRYMWEKVGSYKITDSNLISIFLDETIDSDVPLNYIDLFIEESEFHEICIKGVSDNREDFMINYFNNN